MKKIALLLCSILLIHCCNGQSENQQQKKMHTKEVSENKIITDSLFIGEPLITQKVFLNNIKDGGNDFKYFNQFENILKKNNRIFIDWIPNNTSKKIKIDERLSLELSRKYTYSLKNDIQIMLYIMKDNVRKDSVLYYKYQWDKDFPNEQRFENLSYIDNNLNLWKLSTITNQAESALGIDDLSKYKIDLQNGKIKLIERFLNGISENKNSIEPYSKETKSNKIVAPILSVFDVNGLTKSWSNHCEKGVDKDNIMFYSADEIAFNIGSINFICGAISKIINSQSIEIYLKKSGNDYAPNGEVYSNNNVPSGISFDDLSQTIPIAKVEILSANELKFMWFGFYNNKTKKREYLKNPFTNKIEKSFVTLEKCSD